MIEYVLGLSFIIVIAVAALIVANAVVIIRPYERGVVERLGRYNRMMDPGLNFIIPEVEKIRKVDVRESVIDIPSQEVITKDNASVVVDLVIYAQIIDPYRVLYNVSNFEDASIKLAQTSIRSIMGAMNLDEILGARERINLELRQIIDDATDKWGVRVTRVEIQEIVPPGDILEAMAKQMKAERFKRASILEAEGMKESTILRAEGDKTSAILTAEGKASAAKITAEGEKYSKVALADGDAQSILKIFSAIHDGRPTREILMLKYIDALNSISQGPANKVFMPLETMGFLGGAAVFGEAFKTYMGKTPKLEKKG